MISTLINDDLGKIEYQLRKTLYRLSETIKTDTRDDELAPALQFDRRADYACIHALRERVIAAADDIHAPAVQSQDEV